MDASGFSWSYAIGTLFIRFFGIFIVLSILMLGMMVSGKIFTRLERGKKTAEQGAHAPPPVHPPAAEDPPAPEHLAAAAMAVHLHLGGRRTPLSLPRRSAWAEQGRAALMQGFFATRGWKR